MDYPADIYMNPQTGIKRFHALLKKYGLAEVSKSGHRFRVEKELFAAAQFFLALQKMNGHYYFRPGEDISQGTDIRAVTAGHPDAINFQSYDVQLTEFESHSTNLIEIIKKKIDHQLPEVRETRDLVVEIRDHAGELFYPDEIASEVARLGPTFKTIWLIVDDASDEMIVHVTQVWPRVDRVTYNLVEEFKSESSPSLVRLRPDTQTKEEFDKSEHYDLPLP